MARKHHHTRRQHKSKFEAMKKWEKGISKAGFPIPTKEQYNTFISSFNMGYKIGYRNALHPKIQQSKWKPVLDALCRVKDPISWEEAKRILGCTEKALQKHMDSFEYFPTNEDMHISYEQQMETMKFLDNMFNKDKSDIEVKEVLEVSDEKAEELIINYIKTHNKTAYISELAENLCLDIEQIIKITNKLEEEKKIQERPLIHG